MRRRPHRLKGDLQKGCPSITSPTSPSFLHTALRLAHLSSSRTCSSLTGTESRSSLSPEQLLGPSRPFPVPESLRLQTGPEIQPGDVMVPAPWDLPAHLHDRACLLGILWVGITWPAPPGRRIHPDEKSLPESCKCCDLDTTLSSRLPWSCSTRPVPPGFLLSLTPPALRVPRLPGQAEHAASESNQPPFDACLGPSLLGGLRQVNLSLEASRDDQLRALSSLSLWSQYPDTVSPSQLSNSAWHEVSARA